MLRNYCNKDDNIHKSKHRNFCTLIIKQGRVRPLATELTEIIEKYTEKRSHNINIEKRNKYDIQ